MGPAGSSPAVPAQKLGQQPYISATIFGKENEL